MLHDMHQNFHYSINFEMFGVYHEAFMLNTPKHPNFFHF